MSLAFWGSARINAAAVDEGKRTFAENFGVVAMIARRGHPVAGIEAEDLELDSGYPGDIAGYVANIHEPGARSDAELDHGYGFQTLRLGELCRLEKAERILLPHH